MEKTLQIEVDQALWSACLENSYEQFLSDILEAANSGDPRAFIPLSSSIVYMLSAVAESNCIPGLPAVLTTQEIQSVIMKTVTNLALADDLETMEMNCNN